MDDTRTRALAARWCDDYTAVTGHPLHEITLGQYTYAYDTISGRAVCVVGRSAQPAAARDAARQRGFPRARAEDDRGHLIAHSMGGPMDVNMFSQHRHLNRSNEWRSLERQAASNPGTPVAVHLRYEGDADRPSLIDYAYEDRRGLHVVEFDNNRGTRVRERTIPPMTPARSSQPATQDRARQAAPSRDRR